MKEENVVAERGTGEWEMLRMFKREYTKIPMLSREEELPVARRARAGDQVAIDLLVESNLRFVIYVTLKQWRYGLPLMDLVSAGYIGLMQAVKTFDPEMGFRFLTYAHDAIVHRVYKAKRDHFLNKHDSLDSLVFDDGSETTYVDLLSSDDVMEAWWARRIANEKQTETEFPECPACHRQVKKDVCTCPHCKVGFQKPHRGENPILYIFKRGKNYRTDSADLLANKQMRRAFSALDNRERRIIILRFWMDMDRAEIAKKIGLSRNRLMHIENGALRKMRWSMTDFNTNAQKTPEPGGVAVSVA